MSRKIPIMVVCPGQLEAQAVATCFGWRGKEKMMSFFLFKGVGNINHGDQDSVLYSWGRHSTLTVPLFTLKTVRKY